MTLRDAFAQAFAAERVGDVNRARAIYEDILTAIPDQPGALLGIARHARVAGAYDQATDLLARALRAAREANLQMAELLVESANLQAQRGDREAARVACRDALRERPGFVPALLRAGDLELQDAEFSSAESYFREALAGQETASAWTGLAQSLAGQHRALEARSALERALALAPDSPDVRAAAAWVALQDKDWREAEGHCHAILSSQPDDPTLLGLLGQAQRQAGAFVAAQRSLERALAARPGDPELRVALGAVLIDLGYVPAARQELERAVRLGGKSGEMFANLGLTYQAEGDYETAAQMFRRAVEANARLTPALVDLVRSLQYLCAWDELEEPHARLLAAVDDPASDPRVSPFVALGLGFSPQQQLEVSRRWSRAMLPAVVAPAVVAARGERLRIGYLSSDFREHATGRLIVGLIEAHDRRRVEVFGYGYGRTDDSRLRRRIVAAFDQWRDLEHASDAAIAETIRADRIDVLLDVKGHTHGARLGALAKRPANTQLHYLAFPATLGYDAIDGIVADAIVAPPHEDAFCHERVLRLPRCYLATDGARAVPAAASRSDHGLPEHGLVLACLNQTYKLTSTVFGAWMQALLEAPDAVLWLYASHPRVQANLRGEARRRGVREDRLIFAANLPNEAHLARVGCADLALDTLPCGSHTTAVDALRCNVPLITQCGTTFAGRVGASLLEAVRLRDLITHTLDEYRERLCALVRDPERIRGYRLHLEHGRDTLPLWDTRGLAADIEQLLQDVVATRS